MLIYLFLFKIIHLEEYTSNKYIQVEVLKYVILTSGTLPVQYTVQYTKPVL